MKGTPAAPDAYQKQYVDLDFERGGLFEVIQKAFQPVEVLYPGCSVHLTPAFYFPHVVFVDQAPAASAFFSDRELVLDLVNRHRKYRRTPYVRFIAQDFTQPLPLAGSRFDLLLALYTGGVSKACTSYLKVGGVLVTNDHQDDALEAAQHSGLARIGVIGKQGDRYAFGSADPGEGLQRRAGRRRRYLRRARGGFEYIDEERYHVFRKVRPPVASSRSL
jgi:hypothetical protein